MSRRARSLLVLLAGLAVGSCAIERGAAPATTPGAARARAESAPIVALRFDDAARLRAECGIELVRVATTAGGEMLELRYVVHDLALARVALEQPLALETPASGERLDVSSVIKLGRLMTAPRAVGRVHHALLRNPGRAVAAGDSVAVLAGGGRYDGLTVQ